jgi:hypothetical protein
LRRDLGRPGLEPGRPGLCFRTTRGLLSSILRPVTILALPVPIGERLLVDTRAGVELFRGGVLGVFTSHWCGISRHGVLCVLILTSGVLSAEEHSDIDRSSEMPIRPCVLPALLEFPKLTPLLAARMRRVSAFMMTISDSCFFQAVGGATVGRAIGSGVLYCLHCMLVRRCGEPPQKLGAFSRSNFWKNDGLERFSLS